MTVDRTRARTLARESVERGDPVGWFDRLYREADAGTTVVPWADLIPNPHLVEWLDRSPAHAGEALDVGCGLGDNAEELARRGYTVSAFDVAAAAVERARQRFPQSRVRYEAADLLRPPAHWQQRFALVAETYTLQVLPPEARAVAITNLRSFLAPGGLLLVIARGREEDEPEGSMPWPLTHNEVEAIAGPSLALRSFEDFQDEEDPPVRRFRAVFECTLSR